MRILKVSFQNINSLAGEWSIDFSAPEYQNGLFAITGPTGAGKSSILDAIALALYGQTPRLGKVGRGGGNDIMSRGSARCYAEVIFETKAGRYRCQWSQWRARFALDGDLQPPRHEILEADTGLSISSSLKKVPDEVEEVTGLDFHRFTRAMLLAQGDFSVFLKADPDERAPILERITGTGIYSQISKSVHERKNAELEKLSVFEKELHGLQDLDEIGVKQLECDLISLEKDLQQRRIHKEQARAAWDILQNLDDLEKRRVELLAAGKLLAQDRLAFEPSKKIMEADSTSRALMGAYENLSFLRKERLRAEQEVKSLQHQLPGLEEAANASNNKLKKTVMEDKQAKDEQKQSSAHIVEARALDIEIKEVSTSALELEKGCKAARDSLNADDKFISATQKDLNILMEEIKTVQARLAQSAADEILVNNFTFIKISLNNIKQNLTKKRQLEASLKNNKDLIDKTEQHVNQQQKQISRLKDSIAELRCQLKEKDASINQNIFDGKGISYWRSFLIEAKDRYAILQQCLAAAGILENNKSLEKDLKEKISRRNLDLMKIQQQLNRESTNLHDVEMHVARLEKELSLYPAQLDELRAALAPGCPCPLCGSNEHPYAGEDNYNITKKRSELENELEERKGRAVKLRQEETRLKVEISSLQTSQDKDLSQLEELAAKILQDIDMLAKNVAALSLGDNISFGALQEHAGHLLSQGRAASEAVAKGEALEQEAVALRQNLDKNTAALNELEKNISESLQTKTTLVSHMERDQSELNSLNDDMARELQAARGKTAQILPPWNEDEIQEVTAALETRFEKRINLSKQAEELAANIKLVESKLSLSRTSFIKASSALKDLEKQAETANKRLQELVYKRSLLLDGEAASTFEERLNKKLQAASLALENAGKEQQKVQTELSAGKAILEASQKELLRINKEITLKEKDFAVSLSGLNLADEVAWLATLLGEEQRDLMLKSRQELDKREAVINNSLAEIDSSVRAARLKHTDKRDKQTLHNILLESAAAEEDLQRRIGALKQKQSDNAQLYHKRKETLVFWEEQKKECGRWEKLHQLIGSADGKKYRNFAQGITFEIMVSEANRRLESMNDRYLLTRDPQKPLELNVIDNYQAGQMRSTKNLSGGESFIVSLALALGLASMNGSSIRVDSLFLDEGFGTLDEETLETALDCLATLSHSGKVVGVISHVPMLVERISVKINVLPVKNGRSVISGPGVDSPGQQD